MGQRFDTLQQRGVVFDPAPQKTIEALMPAGTSETTVIDLRLAGGVFGLDTDAAWEPNHISFMGSYDGVTFKPILTEWCEEATLPNTIATQVPADSSMYVGTDTLLNLMRFQFLKVRSGTASAPVNQTQNTTITLVCRT